MGCCTSTLEGPSSSPSSSPSTTPPSDPPHGTPPTVSSSEPDTVMQAPLLSSNGSSGPAHDLAPRDIETTEQTPSQAHPLPDAHASLPSRNRVTARIPEPPPLALPVSPSSHNEGTLVSSPSRHIAVRTAYPPAHHKIEIPKYQPHEHNGTRPAPSACQSPSIKKSTSAQPLSRSGLPAISSHPLTRAMSASGSGPGPEAESRSRPREHPRSTRRANTAPVADDDGNPRFPSIVQAVLVSGSSRYALDGVSSPLLNTIIYRFRILVVGKVRAGRCEASSRSYLSCPITETLWQVIAYRFHIQSEYVGAYTGIHLSPQTGLLSLLGKTTSGNTPGALRTVDIRSGCTPSQNRHLIVHEHSSFESGAIQDIEIVRDFVTDRTRANCPASERLHAIW